jgi:hypothetical protein
MRAVAVAAVVALFLFGSPANAGQPAPQRGPGAAVEVIVRKLPGAGASPELTV